MARTQLDSAQSLCGPLGYQMLFKGLAGRMKCSGMAYPHFGLSLCLSFHSQRVLKPSWQPHILTEKEDSYIGVRYDLSSRGVLTDLPLSTVVSQIAPLKNFFKRHMYVGILPTCMSVHNIHAY